MGADNVCADRHAAISFVALGHEVDGSVRTSRTRRRSLQLSSSCSTPCSTEVHPEKVLVGRRGEQHFCSPRSSGRTVAQVSGVTGAACKGQHPWRLNDHAQSDGWTQHKDLEVDYIRSLYRLCSFLELPKKDPDKLENWRTGEVCIDIHDMLVITPRRRPSIVTRISLTVPLVAEE